MARNTAPLTGVERTFSDDEFIITMTDAKGIITYCNNTCLSIAGYTEDEIIGKPHNILRHPDMPRCIFKFLWDTIQTGDELLAYVINKCKNGDHYWVFAHVTATYDDSGQIIGYLSSRRSPTKEALEAIKPVYAQLKAEEEKHSNTKDGMQAGLDMFLGTLKDKDISYGEFVMSL